MCLIKKKKGKLEQGIIFEQVIVVISAREFWMGIQSEHMA